MNKVLILGCGPAGLMAAHAASMAGYEPVIISKKRKSEMFGAQYLHRPIPDTTDQQPFEVKYVLNGTAQAYREKVYGPAYRGFVSPEDLDEDHSGWDIRATYDILWQRYSGAIEHTPFSNEVEVTAFINRVSNEGTFHSVISTIPAPLLCTNNSHAFQAQKVYAIGDAPERGVFSPIMVDLNTVVCSGESDRSWYRAANILGYHTVEWPGNKRIPLDGVTEVTKPLGHTCECLPYVHRMGRYGKWQKGVLSHESYFETFAGLGGVLDEEVSFEESGLV